MGMLAAVTPAMHSDTRMRLARALGALGLLGTAALYLVQHVRMTPNQVDGGLLLDHVARVAAGQRPYVDFVDVYGPWTWPLLAAGYRAFGERVLGARVALWLIELACVTLHFALVRRAAGTAYAIWASAALCILLGVPWQLSQDPYPYAQALLCELGCLWLWLGSERRASLALSGAVCAVALLTKLNTGLLLCVAGCVHCLYVHGDSVPAAAGPLRVASRTGLIAWAVVTLALVDALQHLSFAGYLLVPVCIAVAELWQRDDAGMSRARFTAFSGYLGAVVAAAAGGLALSVGADRIGEYIVFQGQLLTRLQYAVTPPAPGTPGVFVGFNEHGWTLTPWLASGAYAAHAWLARGRAPTEADRNARGAFIVFTLHQFVIYTRADEAHIYQALLLVPATLALALHALTRDLQRLALPRASWAARAGVALVCALALDLGSVRGLPQLAQSGDWGTPRMRGLMYRADHDPHVRASITHMTEREEDAATDQTARYLAAHLRPGDEVLAFNRNTLVPFAAGAVVSGGRYAYLLYLLRNGFVSDADVEALAPGLLLSVRRGLPAFVLGSIGKTELEGATRGFDLWLLRNYQHAAIFGPLLLYERKTAPSPASPARLP